MKPKIKKFTKDNPCTMVDIWNCFRIKNGFRNVQIGEAQSLIGINVPNYMLRMNRLVIFEIRREEYYVLTHDGAEWLERKFTRYLQSYPESKNLVKYLPSKYRY